MGPAILGQGERLVENLRSSEERLAPLESEKYSTAASAHADEFNDRQARARVLTGASAVWKSNSPSSIENEMVVPWWPV